MINDIEGANIMPPPPGWLHLWCPLKTGPSPTYPIACDWRSMNWNRMEFVIPALIMGLKKLWTPPDEKKQRKAECIAAFSIAKAERDAKLPR